MSVARIVPARLRAAALVLAIPVALAGCAATVPVREAPPAVSAAEAQRLRAAWMLQTATWGFSGRAAISRGDRGGSGRIEWDQQDRDRYAVALSAPVTRQSWRLSGDLASGAGRIEGLEGGPREGRPAEALLLQTTGWEVPLAQLGSWVRGAPADGLPIDAIEFDARGRPTLLRQSGWTVRYTAWRSGPPGGPELPARIEAESGAARVRLAIEDWVFATP